MEYYIMKIYQKDKEKNPNIKQGLNRFETKIKNIAIGSLVIMLISCIEMLVTFFVFPQKLWFVVGVIPCLVASLVLLWVDNKDQKENIDNYVDSSKEKIEVLNNVLITEFNIDKKEKVEELINIYQMYVDSKKQEEKHRNKIIFTLFSAFAGILSISLSNMDKIGIDLITWIYLAVFLLIFVAIAGIFIHINTYVDSLKKKYEIMIKELNDLMLIKY